MPLKLDDLMEAGYLAFAALGGDLESARQLADRIRVHPELCLQPGLAVTLEQWAESGGGRIALVQIPLRVMAHWRAPLHARLRLDQLYERKENT